MNNLTAMAKADVATVHHGWIQAIVGPIAYISYLPNFVNHKFSVDSKTFTHAIKNLEADFHCRIYDKKIQLFDSEQEIVFEPKHAEIMLQIPPVGWQHYDLTHNWMLVDQFISTQFPGVRVTKNYLEVLSDASIVRVEGPFTFNSSRVFAQAKINKKAQAWCFYNQKLWIRYDSYNFVAISQLDLHLPSTDNFFNQSSSIEYKVIPQIIKHKLLPCDTVQFTDKDLVFISKDTAQATLEGIEGVGCYNYTLFAKVIKFASHWRMSDKFMHFSGKDFTGVIENQEDAPF